MLMRSKNVTMTDLEIMVYLYRSKTGKSAHEFMKFLSVYSEKNAHTYISRLKKKGYLMRDAGAGKYKLTPSGVDVLSELRNELSLGAHG